MKNLESIAISMKLFFATDIKPFENDNFPEIWEKLFFQIRTSIGEIFYNLNSLLFKGDCKRATLCFFYSIEWLLMME